MFELRIQTGLGRKPPHDIGPRERMQPATEALSYSPEGNQRRVEYGETRFCEGRLHKQFKYGCPMERSQAKANRYGGRLQCGLGVSIFESFESSGLALSSASR
jgi:hypothetical protein